MPLIRHPFHLFLAKRWQATGSRAFAASDDVASTSGAAEDAGSASETDGRAKKEPKDRMHTTAVNIMTNDRSLIRFQKPKANFPAIASSDVFELDENARKALRSVVVSVEMLPTQLQQLADKLYATLEQRPFPVSAERVQLMRKEFRLRAEAEVEGEFDQLDDHVDLNFKRIEKMTRRKVDLLLKKSGLPLWKPLVFPDHRHAATYALARFSPNVAELRRVLGELRARRPGWSPRSVLDYGSGVGASWWAVEAELVKPENAQSPVYTFIEANDHINRIAIDLMQTQKPDGKQTPNALRVERFNFRRALPPATANTYDLVIVHRSLAEFPEVSARIMLMEELWRRTKRFLVIVESPRGDHFDALLEVRDRILAAGRDVDRRELRRMLGKSNDDDDSTPDEELELELSPEDAEKLAQGKLDDLPEEVRVAIDEKIAKVREAAQRRETEAESKLPSDVRSAIKTVLADKNLTPIEEHAILEGPFHAAGFEVPTELPTANVVAPCPHSRGCPMAEEKMACTNVVHWKPSRADGKHATHPILNENGVARTKFSYVILERRQPGSEETQDWSRILNAKMSQNGNVTAELCTPFSGLQRMSFGKASPIASSFKRRKDGDIFPYDISIVESESPYEVFDEARREFERKRGNQQGTTDESR